MLVRFTRRWRMYNAGEEAAFDEAVADQLISGGFAVPAAQEPVEAEKPAARKRAPKAEAEE
jgi:hypothetical protein